MVVCLDARVLHKGVVVNEYENTARRKLSLIGSKIHRAILADLVELKRVGVFDWLSNGNKLTLIWHSDSSGG